MVRWYGGRVPASTSEGIEDMDSNPSSKARTEQKINFQKYFLALFLNDFPRISF